MSEVFVIIGVVVGFWAGYQYGRLREAKDPSTLPYAYRTENGIVIRRATQERLDEVLDSFGIPHRASYQPEAGE